ncbi:3-oxoacyl-(acyl-carrier-protein) synthase 3 protein 1 [uncultured spirochete]|uniref:Beta-ketoacyl-[acyl-carrier-protein] synthase III n=1 Tax=uncultured spirochete TaxID=156406 RepID=A0A3P3XV33_9SPIR|nr:3-oxoacyl-(acyl-carrier-protein) synthase 3 protein 1 [uncultured spirochete]
MSVVIRSISSYVPPVRITNEELAARMETTDEWIRSHTGIGARHIAPDGVQTSDMAVSAAQSALEKAKIGTSDIDYIIVATATPDYFGFPATACIVQDKLGAYGAAAFDVTAGCTGFIYALNIASRMLESSHGRHALVIGADGLSRIVDWNDRSTAVLFGDGAGAAVVSRIDEGGRGCLSFILGADGSGAKELYLVQPERTQAFDRQQPVVPVISMNGKKVYDFAVKSITVVIERLLHKTAYRLEDFSWIVPHQANARIVQAAAKRFSIPMDKIYMNIEEYANTSAASIPLALAEMDEKGLLKPNDLVMLVGFGAGLTYGAAVVRW